MWDEFDDDDGWEPIRTRRRRSLQLIAFLVVAAMVLALVIPALLRLLSEDDGGDEPQGVRTAPRAVELVL